MQAEPRNLFFRDINRFAMSRVRGKLNPCFMKEVFTKFSLATLLFRDHCQPPLNFIRYCTIEVQMY